MRKTSKNNISRKNKKSKKNIKNNIKYNHKKNKINNMIGGHPRWNNVCGICLANFKWTDDKWIETFGPKPKGFNSNNNETAEPLVISNISKLPCGHIVHTSCINDMLKYSPIRECPSCTIPFREEEVLPVGEYEYDKDYFIELFKSNNTFDLSNFLSEKLLFKIETEFENRLPKHFKYIKFEKSKYEYNDIIESISDALLDIKNDNEDNFKIKEMDISKLSRSLDEKILTKLVSGLLNILKQNFKSFKIFNFTFNFNLKLNHLILLAKGLELNDTLEKLDISFNNINDDRAVIFLGKALQKNKTLKTLDMRYNHIGKEGAEALVSCIEANKSLTRLHMDANNIGIEAAEGFMRVILENIKLYKSRKLHMTLYFVEPYAEEDKEDIDKIRTLLAHNNFIIGSG